jgi:hypothetical protein
MVEGAFGGFPGSVEMPRFSLNATEYQPAIEPLHSPGISPRESGPGGGDVPVKLPVLSGQLLFGSNLVFEGGIRVFK